MTRNLFDEQPNEAAKDHGIAVSEDANERAVDVARAVAREIALADPDRTCYADLVGMEFERRGLEWSTGWTGGLFRTKDWEFTNRFEKSKRGSRHAGLQMVWRYVGKA